jgi:hypothetical protein
MEPLNKLNDSGITDAAFGKVDRNGPEPKNLGYDQP